MPVPTHSYSIGLGVKGAVFYESNPYPVCYWPTIFLIWICRKTPSEYWTDNSYRGSASRPILLHFTKTPVRGFFTG